MCWQRTPATSGHSRRNVYLEAWHVAPQVIGEVGGPDLYLGGRSPYHSEGWKVFFGGAVKVGVKGRFQGGEAELVGAKGAGEGMVSHGGDPTRSAYRYPCLRPAEELVSREDGEVSAIPEDSLYPGFFTNGQQCPAAHVGDDRES